MTASSGRPRSGGTDGRLLAAGGMAAMALTIAFSFAATGLSGCAADPTEGYAFATAYRTDVETVAVPIFENDTFYREVPFELTDALIKTLESRTPYRIVAVGEADTVLRGRVRTVELDVISRSRITGLAEEALLNVTVDFEWVDLRRDELLLRREAFTGTGLFVPSPPSGEPIELGEFAAVQELAADIVDEMQSEW